MAHADSRRDALEQLRKSFVKMKSVQCRNDDRRKNTPYEQRTKELSRKLDKIQSSNNDARERWKLFVWARSRLRIFRISRAFASWIYFWKWILFTPASNNNGIRTHLSLSTLVCRAVRSDVRSLVIVWAMRHVDSWKSTGRISNQCTNGGVFQFLIFCSRSVSQINFNSYDRARRIRFTYDKQHSEK